MSAGLTVDETLDQLERRLDSLEEKINAALEQSMSLLDYVRNRCATTATGRSVTRRIILEETTLLPDEVGA